MGKTINLIEISKIIYNKPTALKFLCNQFKKNTIHCPTCDSENCHIISRGKLGCKDCKTGHRSFAGAWFDIACIDFTEWLALVNLFDLGASVRRAAKGADVRYPTALNAFDCVRHSIPYHLAESGKKLKGKIEADEACFGGRRKGDRGHGARNRTAVFGMLGRDGKVRVEIANNVKAKTLLKSTIRKAKKGGIVHADRWKGCDSLIFNGYKHHLSMDRSRMFGSGNVYVNGIEGFRSLAKESMAKRHGVSPGKFLSYTKEMERRHNDRDEDALSLLLDCVLVVNN